MVDSKEKDKFDLGVKGLKTMGEVKNWSQSLCFVLSVSCVLSVKCKRVNGCWRTV